MADKQELHQDSARTKLTNDTNFLATPPSENIPSASESLTAPATISDQMQVNIENISRKAARGTAEKTASAVAEKVAKKTSGKVAADVAEKKVGDEVEKRQARYTEILGVFVALFTFVSMNFQIFSQIDTLNYAIVLILLLFLCLAGFIVLAHFILTDIKSGKQNNTRGVIRGIIIVTVFVLFVLLGLLPPTPIASTQSQVKEDIRLLEYRIGQLEQGVKTIPYIRFDGGK